MTLEEKSRIVNAITCDECRHFAWHLARMEPKRHWLTRRWHHPNCSKVSGPPTPPSGPLVGHGA